VKTQFLGFENDVPKVEISVFKGDKRVINGFVLQGFTKVPKRFVKNLEKEFVGKTYDDENLLKINSRLENHPFLMLEKLRKRFLQRFYANLPYFSEEKSQ
jgi:hypothetical protein